MKIVRYNWNCADKNSISFVFVEQCTMGWIERNNKAKGKEIYGVTLNLGAPWITLHPFYLVYARGKCEAK